MKLIIPLLLAFASSLALAHPPKVAQPPMYDRVAPLFDMSAPAQLRQQEVELSDRLADPSVKKVQTFKLNREAFNSTVVTVSVNGKTHRFTGTATKFDATPTVTIWSGGNGKLTDRLTFGEDLDGGIAGHIAVSGHNFTIHGMKGAESVLIIERQDVPGRFTNPPYPIPADKAASRP